MFEQALLESAQHSPSTRRAYSTAASFLLQSALLAGFVVGPILATQAVPELHQRFVTTLPPMETLPPRVEPSEAAQGIELSTTAPQLVQPRSIHPLDPNPRPLDPVPANMHHPASGAGDPRLASLFSGRPSVSPPVEAGQKQPPVSVLEQGVVLSRVQPLYPHLALVNRVQGSVHLNALITSRGTLEELHVLNGHPMLTQAALDAVCQWKFRPYVLNGKPIDVQTEIIVNFTLD